MNSPQPIKVCQIITSLIQQDRLAFEHFLSPLFLLHEGMSLNEFISHELTMYKEFSPIYELEDGFDINISQEKENQYSIILTNKKHNMVAEWLQTFDQNGLIKGNNSKCQSISKIQTHGDERVRSIAFQSNVPIVSVRPQFNCDYIQQAQPPENPTDFWNLIFSLPNDDYSTQFLPFRIRYANGNLEIKEIWCRGTDRPNNNNPQLQLSQNQKEIHFNTPIPWSVSVKYEDGVEETIPFPLTKSVALNKKADWVCLTDARDFDWICSASNFNLKNI